MPCCRQFEEASGDLSRREVAAGAVAVEYRMRCFPDPESALVLGRRVGPDDPAHVTGVRDGRYEAWVVEVDRVFQEQDPQGTPAALLDGRPVDSSALYDARALGDVLHG